MPYGDPVALEELSELEPLTRGTIWSEFKRNDLEPRLRAARAHSARNSPITGYR
jgi:hypothetical protein